MCNTIETLIDTQTVCDTVNHSMFYYKLHQKHYKTDMTGGSFVDVHSSVIFKRKKKEQDFTKFVLHAMRMMHLSMFFIKFPTSPISFRISVTW